MVAVERGLRKSGQPFRIINLDQDDFDPVMRSKDLLAFVGAGKGGPDALDAVDDQVKEYKRHLEWAEHDIPDMVDDYAGYDERVCG